LLALATANHPVVAQELFLTENAAVPGRLLLSTRGASPAQLHRRPPVANPAYPGASMTLNHVALDSEGQIFFCSGLDRYVMQLLDRRHEVPLLEIEDQVRDVACTEEPQTVYYSVVGTPQSGRPLPDGRIYRRNLGDGRPTLVAAVRQSDVARQWWGTFALQGGAVFIATEEPDSRVFKQTGATWTQVGVTRGFRIKSLAVSHAGKFLFTTGGGKVYETTDFVTVHPALTTELQLRDVALRPPAPIGRGGAPGR
jgi:hypothetical protein